MKPELVSFNICPFVQRSVITMLHKQVPHDITYIDLADPPDWFNDISPLGKVPLLKTDGKVLFESAVINEYIDETTADPLMPADALTRAHNRAWIEFGSNLQVAQYMLTVAKTEPDMRQALEKYRQQISILEGELNSRAVKGPFFNGAEFSLVDTSYAPVFTRHLILSEAQQLVASGEFPEWDAWVRHLVAIPAVQQSVISNFREEFVRLFSSRDSYLFSQLET